MFSKLTIKIEMENVNELFLKMNEKKSYFLLILQKWGWNNRRALTPFGASSDHFYNINN